MDNGWDHTENEDKVLLNQSWDLSQIKDQDMQVTSVRTMANTKDGCSDNMGRSSGGYELVSLSGEYDIQLLSVVINILNTNNSRLSIQSIDFINNYHMFLKLLYNTFYPLFYNLIYFNLSNLDSYITSIISAYYCILSDLKIFETTLIPAAKNTYKSIRRYINKLKCSACVYSESLKDLKCGIKKIQIHAIPSPLIKELTAKLTVKYKINMAELKKSIQSCLCQINCQNFELSKIDIICEKISKLKSNMCSDIKLLCCLRCYLTNFNMFDENVCRLRRFILLSVPRTQTFEPRIRKILVDFNKDIDDKSQELESVKTKLTEMEECVQNKLDSLNRILTAEIKINGFKIKKIIDVECKPPKLVDDSSYKCFKSNLLNQNIHLNNIKSDLVKLKFDDSIGKIKRGVSSISELLFKRFFRCSIQSVSTNVINIHSSNHNMSTNNTSSSQIKNAVMSVMSRIVIEESMFVISRLYIYYKIKAQIFEILSNFQNCLCMYLFDKRFINAISHNKITKKFVNSPHINQYYLHKDVDNSGNYICLCLVLRYVLLTDIYVLNNYIEYIYYDILSWLSRKFKKYTYLKTHISLAKTIVLLIKVIYKITLRVKNIFNENGNCYCTKINERYHPYLISTIIFVSSLMENIWTMDPETLRMSIEKLSVLYSQLEIYDLNSTILKPVCCNPLYSLIVHKECKPKPQEKCCCCWCVAAFNLAMILIYLCLQCKLFNAFTGKNKCD